MPAVTRHRKLRSKAKPAARCRRNKKAKTTSRSGGTPAPCFLKQQFLPITFNENRKGSNWITTETQFFESARNLCNLYKLDCKIDYTLFFPLNISSLYRDLKDQLEKVKPCLYLVIAENEGVTTLATIRPLQMERTLYFMPINALDLFHRNKNKQCFELLLSIFGYLNKCARLPLLCENDYLTGCYEAIGDWIENAQEEIDLEDYVEQCAEMKCLLKKNHILEKAIKDPVHFSLYEKRIQKFRPASELEKKLKQNARKMLTLYRQYPARNFYQNISCDHLEEDEGERMYPDHYFSFFWDDQGNIHDHLMEYVNCDLQEMCETEVPVSVQYFDKPQTKEIHALEFETRLIELMEDLCSILYQFSYEKHHR